MLNNRLRSLTCAIAITAAAAAFGGCTTTTTTSQGWGYQPPYYPGAVGRAGHVEWIQETIERREGNPVGGAIAGAVIGGIVGHVLSGGHGDGGFGAVTGAVIGADASSGGSERRLYQTIVRFDDGSAASYLYEGYPPFSINQRVIETPQGLAAQFPG
jgi:outer membrane lipoprotein SlyB